MELWSTGLWPIIIYCACFLFPPALNGPSLFISPLNLEPGLTSTSSYCDGPRFSLFFFLSSVLAFLLESCSECVIFHNLIFITIYRIFIFIYPLFISFVSPRVFFSAVNCGSGVRRLPSSLSSLPPVRLSPSLRDFTSSSLHSSILPSYCYCYCYYSTILPLPLL